VAAALSCSHVTDYVTFQDPTPSVAPRSNILAVAKPEGVAP